METGFHSMVCRYKDVEVFRATMSPGIAADPYLKFYTRAVESGELEFWWLDDDDVQGTARSRIAVG